LAWDLEGGKKTKKVGGHCGKGCPERSVAGSAEQKKKEWSRLREHLEKVGKKERIRSVRGKGGTAGRGRKDDVVPRWGRWGELAADLLVSQG